MSAKPPVDAAFASLRVRLLHLANPKFRATHSDPLHWSRDDSKWRPTWRDVELALYHLHEQVRWVDPVRDVPKKFAQYRASIVRITAKKDPVHLTLGRRPMRETILAAVLYTVEESLKDLESARGISAADKNGIAEGWAAWIEKSTEDLIEHAGLDEHASRELSDEVGKMTPSWQVLTEGATLPLA